MSKKHNYEYVKGCFKEQGCELLEKEYKNNKTKMKYKCNCKNISKITFSNFKKGHRCAKCGGNNKYTFKYVYQYFEENDCKLLEKEYKNTLIKMTYICSCGNESEICFNHFRQGVRCKKCSGCEKHTLKFVKQFFKNNDCELLEKKYINAHYKMKYICNCGNISKIAFSNFQQGGRCKKCGDKKKLGENNHNYNPNLTDEERENNKSRLSDPIYKKWRTKIYKKNNYTCQKCFKKGCKLNAHHIENYATNKKLRLVKSNGITFCKNCHKKFHKIYGIKDNNKQQLNQYLTVNI